MINVNTTEVYKLVGGIEGLAVSLSSTWYTEDLTKYIGSELTERFDSSADAWAMSHGDMIDHMYEWNMSGIPAGRLWKTFMAGRGKSRLVNYSYLPSKTFVPVPEALTEPNQNTGASVKVDSHIFKNKAMVMETGQTVTILPKGNNNLAFIDQSTGEIAFSTRSILTPGRKVQGNFTTLWLAWWENIAPDVLERIIGPEIQKENAAVFTRTMNKAVQKNLRFEVTTPGSGKFASAKTKRKVIEEMKKMIRRKAG